jgi:hypothetical protein
MDSKPLLCKVLAGIPKPSEENINVNSLLMKMNAPVLSTKYVLVNDTG